MAPNLAERIEQTRTQCDEALNAVPLIAALESLSRSGLTEQEQREIVFEAGRSNRCSEKLQALGEAGRALLVRTALTSLDRLPELPVDDSVKHLFCREFGYYANPPEAGLARFAMDGQAFPAMCGIVSLQRFPAGQHQWIVSGFPRSWFLKTALHRIPELSYFVFRKMGGLAPYFVPHVNNTTFKGGLFTEREYYKSFYRMASAIAKQPAIRGIMAGSWLHSRETHRISPHLEFLNRPYLEAGGFYVDRSLADRDEGFLSGDARRVALYEAGQYRPTFGLVFCTRAQALAWKHAHQEIESQLDVR